MGDSENVDDQADREVIEREGRYELTLGPAGHQIWDLEAPSETAAIETFPDGDAGFEAAWSRFQELGRQARRERNQLIPILCVAAIVAEVAWICTGLLTSAFIYASFRGAEGFDAAQQVQVIDQGVQHLALGLLAILITIWLRRRLTAAPATQLARRP